MKLWALIALLITVMVGTVAVVVVVTVMQPSEPPLRADLLEMVPPDACIVVCMADTKSLLEKGQEAFTWVAGVAESVMPDVLDLFGVPMPPSLPFPLPGPSPQTPGMPVRPPTFLDIIRQGTDEAMQQVLAELRRHGVDVSRPQVVYAFLVPEVVKRWEEAAKRGEKHPDEMPFTWVHCIPLESKDRFNYGNFTGSFFGPDAVPRAWETLYHSGYAIVCFDPAVKQKVAKFLAQQPRMSLWDNLRPGEQEFIKTQDVAAYLCAFDRYPRLPTAATPTPPAGTPANPPTTETEERLEALLGELQRDLNATAFGLGLTEEGVRCGAYVSFKQGSKFAQMLTPAQAASAQPISVKYLPANSFAAGQVCFDKPLIRAIADLTDEGIPQFTLDALPDAAALAVLKPDLGQAFGDLMAGMQNAAAQPTAAVREIPLPIPLAAVISVKGETDYKKRQQEIGDLAAAVLGSQAAPTVTVTPGVGSCRGQRLDSITVQWSQQTSKTAPPSQCAVSILSYGVPASSPRMALFAAGMGSEGSVEQMLGALQGQGGLAQAPSFQFVGKYLPDNSTLLAVGPMIEKGSNPLEGLANALAEQMGVQGSGQSSAGDKPSYYTNALSVKAEAGAARMDIFISAATCRMIMEQGAKGFLSFLLDMGKSFGGF